MTSSTLETETMEVSLEAVMDANGELSSPIIQEEQVRLVDSTSTDEDSILIR
jgi:hypothetical protein